MNRGMLWFDNNPKTNLADKMAEDGKISIRGYRPVLPGYLWIGLAEKN